MKSALQITFDLLFTVFSTGVLVKNCVAFVRQKAQWANLHGVNRVEH